MTSLEVPSLSVGQFPGGLILGNSIGFGLYSIFSNNITIIQTSRPFAWNATASSVFQHIS